MVHTFPGLLSCGSLVKPDSVWNFIIFDVDGRLETPLFFATIFSKQRPSVVTDF